MIQGINQKRNVFTHVAADIVRPGQQLRRLIYQICSQYAVNVAVFVVFVKLLESVGKQTESCTDKDLFRFSPL